MKDKNRELLHWCLQKAKSLGAEATRLNLHIEKSQNIEMRDGQINRCGSENGSLLVMTFYKNQREVRLKTDKLYCKKELGKIIRQSLEMADYLEPDADKGLAARERKYKGNMDIGCTDPEVFKMDETQLLEWAQRESRYQTLKQEAEKQGLTLISEVISVGFSYYKSYLYDSDGFEGCREMSGWMTDAEVTIKDSKQNIYNQGDYDYQVRKEELVAPGNCSQNAFQRCLKRIGSSKCEGFCGCMVVSNERCNTLVTPLTDALRAEYIHYDQSFLNGKLNQKIFPESFSLWDLPHQIGHHSCLFYDSEGVATQKRALIEKGAVRHYICSTEMARKTGLAPTCCNTGQIHIEPFLHAPAPACKDLQTDKKEITLQDILSCIQDGIYVTGFNGGNCNALSGDFSYGIEGFRIREGKLEEAVSGMVITGNMIDLFSHLFAVGTDHLSKLNNAIGSMAFEKVTFNA